MSPRTGDLEKNKQMFQNLYGDHKNSKAVPIDIKTPFVMSPAWLPVRCGRQGQAIVVNQASARGNSGWEHSMQTL